MTDIDTKLATNKCIATVPRWSVSLAEFVVVHRPHRRQPTATRSQNLQCSVDATGHRRAGQVIEKATSPWCPTIFLRLTPLYIIKVCRMGRRFCTRKWSPLPKRYERCSGC